MNRAGLRLAARLIRRCLPALTAMVLIACAGGAAPTLVQPRPPASVATIPTPELGAIPLLAYYYIWFDPKSWARAKTDLPLLGPYSSDDRAVMQQHVRSAKAAGINGFIVSWKSSTTLNRRLKQLIEVANQEDFKLLIIYQGLDFSRNPLAVERIAADLDYFIEQFAEDKAFTMFDRPVVIWSGTWKFSPAEVAYVTSTRRDHLRILASERNAQAYQRLADLVDGDAYYWSSVNPETFPNYQAKLDTMARAVHANGGIWLAPAAVGFDARLIGGTRIVDRKDGQTLRAQLEAALKSAPDGIGLISWNEFSENSHVEPSRAYGQRYLDVLRELHDMVAACDALGNHAMPAPPAAATTPTLALPACTSRPNAVK
jgi:Glycosyl hydrolase family 71